MEVKIKYSAKINELANKYMPIESLKSISIKEKSYRRWKRNKTTSYDLQVIFIGKTGYGKSTTINSIIGKDVFESSDFQACTKICQSAEFQMSEDDTYFSICDLPGIGESLHLDKEYFKLYMDMLEKTDLIVYLLRADNRDFAIDEKAFKKIFNNISLNKVLIGLNCADKIEPIDRYNYSKKPTQIQLQNIEKKIVDVSRIFNIHRNCIIPYSALERWNIDVLVNSMVNNILYNNKWSVRHFSNFAN